jgi:hypothetical protein
MKSVRYLLVTTAVLTSFAWTAAAQTGTIAGRVLDQSEALIPGVGVELLASGSDEHIEALTEGDGTYRFENVPAGPAELTFRLINFSTVRREVDVMPGETITLDAVMIVSTSADITITAPATFRNIAELDNPAENRWAWPARGVKAPSRRPS